MGQKELFKHRKVVLTKRNGSNNKFNMVYHSTQKKEKLSFKVMRISRERNDDVKNMQFHIIFSFSMTFQSCKNITRLYPCSIREDHIMRGIRRTILTRILIIMIVI